MSNVLCKVVLHPVCLKQWRPSWPTIRFAELQPEVASCSVGSVLAVCGPAHTPSAVLEHHCQRCVTCLLKHCHFKNQVTTQQTRYQLAVSAHCKRGLEVPKSWFGGLIRSCLHDQVSLLYRFQDRWVVQCIRDLNFSPTSHRSAVFLSATTKKLHRATAGAITTATHCTYGLNFNTLSSFCCHNLSNLS